jgi:biotin carboxylase
VARRYLLVGSARDRLDYLVRTQPSCRVVVVDHPDVLELKHFDRHARDYPIVEKLLPLDIYGDRGWLDLIRAEHSAAQFAAVLPGLEYPSVAAAMAAEMLGLPGAGAKAALLHRHKDALLARAAAAGLATPRSTTVTSLAELKRVSTPERWVLKPADRQASVGVLVLEAGADKTAAWRASQDAGEASHPDDLFRRSFLAQEFLAGLEFSVELLGVDGEAVFGNVTAKTVKQGVHPVELGHVVPAPLPATAYSELLADTNALVRATGLRTGLAHAEWIVDGRPQLVECAARLPGDSIVELIDRAYQMDLEGAWLAALCGEPVGVLPDRASAVAAIRFLELPAGCVRSVAGVVELAHHGVVRTDLPELGARVGEASDSWSRSGEFVVVAATHDEVTARSDAALAALRIEVETDASSRRADGE